MTKTAAQKARARNANILAHFNSTYGTDASRLEMWQRLCRDLDVDEGSSIAQCKHELKGIYINIGAFLNAKNTGEPIPIFRSYKALQNSLSNPANRFPRALAKESPILRWMLIQV